MATLTAPTATGFDCCAARSPSQAGRVAAGIAGFFDVHVTSAGIGFVVLALLGGSAVPLYAAGWLLIPEEGAELSKGQELFNDLRLPWAHTSLQPGPAVLPFAAAISWYPTRPSIK